MCVENATSAVSCVRYRNRNAATWKIDGRGVTPTPAVARRSSPVSQFMTEARIYVSKTEAKTPAHVHGRRCASHRAAHDIPGSCPRV
jgi:hypothetical protein